MTLTPSSTSKETNLRLDYVQADSQCQSLSTGPLQC